MDTKGSNQNVFGLDLLKVFAIFAIFFAQCVFIFPNGNQLLFQLASMMHFIGLEVLFVLYGFLIGKSIYVLSVSGNFGWPSILKFYKKGFLKFVLVYILILGLNILISLLLNNPMHQVWRYFLMLQNFSTPMPSFFFAESWIIPIIVFAAILLPLVLLIMISFFHSSRSKIFLSTTIFLILLFLLFKCLYHYFNINTTIDQWNTGLKSVVIYRLDAVFIGVLFAGISLYKNIFWQKIKIGLGLLGLLGLGFIFVGIGYFQLLINTYPLLWNVFYLPFTSLSIAFLLPILSEWRTKIMIIRMPVEWISRIALPIYLLHVGVVFQFLNYLYPIANINKMEQVIFVFAYLLISFSVGVVFDFFFKSIFNLK